MPNRISNRQKAEELRHQKRLRAARAEALAGKDPPPGIKIPSAAPRPPAGLAAHRYPAKRSSLGDRQVVAPIGRESK
jgi:hypothetical protein